MLSVQAFASTLVPYNPTTSGGTSGSSQASQATPQTPSDDRDYAGEIFSNPVYTQDPAVTTAVNGVAKAAAYVITFICGVLPHVLAIQIAIDMFCMLIPEVAKYLAVLPVQLFSNVAAEITGIAYTGRGGGPNGPGPAPAAADSSGLAQKSWFLYYLKKRVITIIVVFIMLILLYSGVFMDLVFWIANKAVGLVEGLRK